MAGFENIIKTDNIFFRYAKGKSIEQGNEFHDYHEILYIKNAHGKFISEKTEIDLKPGMLIIIPKETFHTFTMENEDEYTRHCLNFLDVDGCGELICRCTQSIYISYSPCDMAVRLFKDIENSFCRSYSTDEMQLFLYSFFTRLMLELKTNITSLSVSENRDRDSLIYRTLVYINNNFKNDMDIEQIAKNMYVSKSQLSHKFSSELNISIYRYILNKKLIYANRLIKNAVSPALAGKAAGFNDYSAFYRAYKKYYGHSPSAQ